MRVTFIAPARREFLKEVSYYNEQEPGLGTAFAHAVEEATARALVFPEAGSPATKNTKLVFVKRFPFSVKEPKEPRHPSKNQEKEPRHPSKNQDTHQRTKTP